MATETKPQRGQTVASSTEMTAQANETAVQKLPGPRLPYHPAVEERFGIDRAGWMALVDAIFPVATTTQSVILALAYCRQRGLDPFKRCIHIVPIWNKDKGKMVDTIWPGIGELRTTAFRTGLFAGRNATEFGPDITKNFGGVAVTFPEWAQVTVYRMLGDVRNEFVGPKVYWLETFAEIKSGAPNSMWKKRPRGQIDKCAEAAALRGAFPEEIGNDYVAEEAFVQSPSVSDTSLASVPLNEDEVSGDDLENPKPRRRKQKTKPPDPQEPPLTEEEKPGESTPEVGELPPDIADRIEGISKSSRDGCLQIKQELLAAKEALGDTWFPFLVDVVNARLAELKKGK